MRCRPSWSLSTLVSKHACDKNRRSSVIYASIISVFPPHPIPSSSTTKYAVCCCCLHIKESHSDLYSVPSNIRIGPTDANAFRGHRLTTQKGYTCVFCVCFLPIHSGHQVHWTYQPGSHRRKATQDFSSTFFLRCVP